MNEPFTFQTAHEQSQQSSTEERVAYQSARPWSDARPHALVVACSDGRYDAQVDDFLHNGLMWEGYDRLFLPGGPGALAGSASEFMRADQLRAELTFLIKSHGITEVALLFHGPAPGGPDHAACADYRRKFPNRTVEEVARLQRADAEELNRSVFHWLPTVRVRVFHVEVTAENAVRFVEWA